MYSRSFDNEVRATLSSSQTLLPDDAAGGGCGSLGTKDIAAWLSREDSEESACVRSFWPAAGPNLGSGHCSSNRVLQFLCAADRVFELLLNFLMNEWPSEMHLQETSRLCATVFVKFVAVKLEARVAASLGGCSTELIYVNQSTSPDSVHFGNIVHACEQHLRIQIGELSEGTLLKNAVLEEDLHAELDDEDVEKGEQDFQAVLAEIVYCSSAKVREELLQSLALLAGNSMACSRLAKAFSSPIGIFTLGSYFQPQAETPASLAESFPLAYLLRQAASGDDACSMVCLKGLIADATQTTCWLVARELETALSFIPDSPAAQEGGDFSCRTEG